MMTLESSSPVQQPWELLTAQTAHPPPDPEAHPTSVEGRQLARALDAESPCDPACPGPVRSPSTPLLRSQQEGVDAQGCCFRGLGASAGFFLFLFVSSS